VAEHFTSNDAGLVSVNRSVWRPLYRLALTRFKLEG
jgi:hypothetical protein